MKIRSFMGVQDGPETLTLYVLIEGRVRDCAVYMQSGLPANCDVSLEVARIASGGAKVNIRNIDSLPFRIPSDLTYRA